MRMEYKNAGRSDTDRGNTGETGNQQCRTEKHCGGDHADRSHRGGDRDETVDEKRSVRRAVLLLYGNEDHRQTGVSDLLLFTGRRIPVDP